MPKVKVNDIEMYYEIHGEGEPIVFLHGFSASHQMWNPWIPRYEKGFKMILIDMRGHGGSTNPTGEFTHRQSSQDIFALLDKLGVYRFKGVGYSSGGMTLLHVATQQPERVQSMVLLSATHYFPDECRDIQSKVLDEDFDERWMMRANFHEGGAEQIDQLRHQFFNFKDSYEDMNFTPPYLSTIKAKTLIVHGDRDPYFPVKIPVEIYTSIRDSYLWIMPNIGHEVAYPASEQLIETTFDFLKIKWEST